MASYFISYTWAKNGKCGSGCTSVEVDGCIRGFADIKEIIDTIEDDYPDLGQVAVLNWRRFEDEDQEGESNG
ncbi:hypothetical protein [Pseudodesulfovibrio sp.]|uniref:hypothetical protein n=1 Tax=Pseudodesulfovibrio sp. TaxID=2035812 RepID=UPI002621F04D|nr:hypothetical protein [Pseudodesulfovibrio sp.]MDD3310985.1 hypothetical protein [Pseudodesulfovibrio sp.]